MSIVFDTPHGGEYVPNFTRVHNVYKSLVIEFVQTATKAFPYFEKRKHLLVDVCCRALNDISPRYIIDSVRYRDSLTSEAKADIEIMISLAVERAFLYIQARDAVGACYSLDRSCNISRQAFEVINYLEALVFERVVAAKPWHIDLPRKYMADVACMALNNLKPNYVRGAITYLTLVSDKLKARAVSDVSVAVDCAYRVIEDREAKNSRDRVKWRLD